MLLVLIIKPHNIRLFWKLVLHALYFITPALKYDRPKLTLHQRNRPVWYEHRRPKTLQHFTLYKGDLRLLRNQSTYNYRRNPMRVYIYIYTKIFGGIRTHVYCCIIRYLRLSLRYSILRNAVVRTLLLPVSQYNSWYVTLSNACSCHKSMHRGVYNHLCMQLKIYKALPVVKESHLLHLPTTWSPTSFFASIP